MFLSNFTIYLYDRTTFPMICGKFKIIAVSKILFDLVEKMKNKNKKRTRTSLFQSSEDGKKEKQYMWPKLYIPKLAVLIYI